MAIDKDKKFPVAEIFGPTVQGEGVDQGRPCHFVRFGGCDYKCEWCDTPHAVLPQAVRANERLTAKEIVVRVRELPGKPEWVILSGGNPALHDLSDVVKLLQQVGMKIAVETQGSIWKDWLFKVDRLCVSPKPPSAGMRVNMEKLDKICHSVFMANGFLKVVVFDVVDYAFAQMIHQRYPRLPFYLSAGNDAGATVGNPERRDERTSLQVAQDLFGKARWLTNRVMVDPIMRDATVQAQFHVALWGNERGR